MSAYEEKTSELVKKVKGESAHVRVEFIDSIQFTVCEETSRTECHHERHVIWYLSTHQVDTSDEK